MAFFNITKSNNSVSEKWHGHLGRAFRQRVRASKGKTNCSAKSYEPRNDT